MQCGSCGRHSPPTHSTSPLPRSCSIAWRSQVKRRRALSAISRSSSRLQSLPFFFARTRKLLIEKNKGATLNVISASSHRRRNSILASATYKKQTFANCFLRIESPLSCSFSPHSARSESYFGVATRLVDTAIARIDRANRIVRILSAKMSN